MTGWENILIWYAGRVDINIVQKEKREKIFQKGKGDSKFSPLVSIRDDRGEGLVGAPQGLVEHLGLELGELHLQLGVVVGQRLDNAGVPGPQRGLVSAEVLVTWKLELEMKVHTKVLNHGEGHY